VFVTVAVAQLLPIAAAAVVAACKFNLRHAATFGHCVLLPLLCIAIAVDVAVIAAGAL